MNDLRRIEKEVMELPVEDRGHLVFMVWESLEKASVHDAEGIKIALNRDREIESGFTKPISHSEFIKQTLPKNEYRISPIYSIRLDGSDQLL